MISFYSGYNENFIDAFNGSVTDVSNISYAFYGSLWSYNGWNSANYIAAESTNPSRDLPLTIVIGLPFIIVCYVLVNISYLTALTPAQISNSGAVAVVRFFIFSFYECVCMYVCVYIYVCMCIYIYVYIYVRVCACVGQILK